MRDIMDLIKTRREIEDNPFLGVPGRHRVSLKKQWEAELLAEARAEIEAERERLNSRRPHISATIPWAELYKMYQEGKRISGMLTLAEYQEFIQWKAAHEAQEKERRRLERIKQDDERRRQEAAWMRDNCYWHPSCHNCRYHPFDRQCGY